MKYLVHLGLIWIILLSMCTDVNSKKPSSTLSLLSLLPYPNPQGTGTDAIWQPVWGEGPAVFLAARLAVEIINNRSDILHGYRLKLLRGDSGCNIIPKASTSLVKNLFYKGAQVLGVIGPGCSAAGLFTSKIISTNQRGISIPTIHLGGSPIFITEREKFPLSFSMLDVPHTSTNAILAVMQRNGWSNITILYDESHLFYSTIVEHFQQIRIKGLTIPIASVLYRGHIPLSQIRDSENRIILVLVGENMLSQVLCITLRNGYVYPTYQLVFMNRMLSDLRPVNAIYDRHRITCNLHEIFDSAEQSIFLQYHDSSNSPKMKLTDIGLTRNEFRQRYRKLIRKYNRRENVSTEPSLWASVYFDAAWAMALALNNSQDELKSLGLDLAQFKYGQNQITDAIHKQLTRLSFQGLSGQIKFNSTTGFISRGIDISQLKQGDLKLLLYFNGSDLLSLNNRIRPRLQAIDDNFDNYGTVIKVPVPISTLCVIVTVIILILLASFHCISIVYRSFPSLKASDQKVIQMAYIGSYLTIAAIICEGIAVVLDSRENQCKLVHTSFILLFCGMNLIFSTVCSRTWRIYRIFIHFKNPGRLISHRCLFFFICLCLAVEIPAVLVWGVAYPLYPISMRSPSMDQFRINCWNETLKIWFAALLSYNAIILFLSCYFALRCYKISQKDFKSNSVLILAYLLTIELTLGTGIYFLLPKNDSPLQEYLAINTTLLAYISSCWVFLFMPPILPLLKSQHRRQYNSLQCQLM